MFITPRANVKFTQHSRRTNGLVTATTATTAGRKAWTALRVPAGDHGFVHARGEPFESTDPAVGTVVAVLASSQPEDVDAAVATAVHAAATTDWSANGE